MQKPQAFSPPPALFPAPSVLRWAECWESHIGRVIEAARDTAEFASGVPLGRSRTASIRRLRAALADLEVLERAYQGRS